MNPAPTLEAHQACSAPATRRVELLDQELLRLRRWPNLTRLPPDVDVGLAARICALLGRKPTVGFLVARMLDLPHARVAPQLAKLRAMGCIDVVGAAVPLPAQEPPLSEPPSKALPDGRFIALLWRLLTR